MAERRKLQQEEARSERPLAVSHSDHLHCLTGRVEPEATKPTAIAFKTHLNDLRGLKFDNKSNNIDNIFKLDDKKARFIEFVSELLGFNHEQAEQAYEQTLRMKFERAVGREKFADRLSDEDAIQFYTRVWVPDLLSGAASRHDVLRNDPNLIETVRNRANYLARKQGGKGPDFYPAAYPPPHGPDPTMPVEVEQQRARNRERRAVKSPRYER